jgi:transposase
MDQELAEKKQQCVRLSEQGYNYREISEMLGITHSSVRDWIVAEKGKQEKLTD